VVRLAERDLRGTGDRNENAKEVCGQGGVVRVFLFET
jgi:hypothetical protein